jgi:hypothetical protein
VTSAGALLGVMSDCIKFYQRMICVKLNNSDKKFWEELIAYIPFTTKYIYLMPRERIYRAVSLQRPSSGSTILAFRLHVTLLPP